MKKLAFGIGLIEVIDWTFQEVAIARLPVPGLRNSFLCCRKPSRVKDYKAMLPTEFQKHGVFWLSFVPR
jgi:hypothetical protein